MKRLLSVVAVLGVLAGACTAGGGTTSSPVETVNPSGSHTPVTLTVWDYFTERELKNLTDVLNRFNAQYPWIDVKIVPGKQPIDFVRGINSGETFDVGIDSESTNVPLYCSTGGMLDLAPFIKADGMDLGSVFPSAALKYTSYQGVQCTFPLLTDAYGLYYNKDMLDAAGYTEPPKTLSEFTDMAKKLTVFDPDGSIKVAGFMPLSTFYENTNLYNGNAWGTQWYTPEGKSAFATDPAWKQLLQWNKDLVDFYGYDNLQRFYQQLGGPNSEWSSAQAFEQGKVAMLYDGEWRGTFIRDDEAKIEFGTAPFPVADDHSDWYGSGQVGGTVVGISRTSEHPAEAWLLVKFLTTDTKAVETLAELLGNVPTTFDSLNDPKLSSDPQFKPFLDIFSNEHSYLLPLTPAGAAPADLWADFQGKWEAGKVSDLQGGLEQLAAAVDQQLQLG
ncbi:MAG TPA: extracellular solute-binding protein [Actinomycetota bacterium]